MVAAASQARRCDWAPSNVVAAAVPAPGGTGRPGPETATDRVPRYHVEREALGLGRSPTLLTRSWPRPCLRPPGHDSRTHVSVAEHNGHGATTGVRAGTTTLTGGKDAQGRSTVAVRRPLRAFQRWPGYCAAMRSRRRPAQRRKSSARLCREDSSVQRAACRRFAVRPSPAADRTG